MRESSGTPATFSPDEARQIRKRLALQGQPPLCPRCETQLEVEGPIAGVGSEGPHFRVTCKPCFRTAFITEVPGSRPLA
jgi:hypothetical protein